MTQLATQRLRPASHARMRPARLWLYMAVFSVPLVLAGLVVSGLYKFLERTGETMGPVAAAHRQAETGEKYGAALAYRPYAFKLERYRMVQPDVLLVGSSRVMAFAGEGFSASVYNAGGAANTIDQAMAFIDAALALHKPKSVLLGLDFWWFNPNRDDEIDTTMQDTDAIRISLTQLAEPLQWLSDGRISPGQLVAGMLPGYQAPPGIGALAQFVGQGWDRHGRYDYGMLYEGGLHSEDENFERTLERLRKAKASSKFNVAVLPFEESIAELNTIVGKLRAEGIEVVLFLPPVAPPVLSQLTDNPDDLLIPAWVDSVWATGAPVIDAQDPAEIGSGPCEFIDGFHGGEVTYLRILDRIASQQDLLIARAIDRAAVQGLIESNTGHARIDELRPGARPEADFLALGCEKS
ncbi:hypothetical protein [Dongia mobilis]|nr:hypothetical protein [Dongia mobilis]